MFSFDTRRKRGNSLRRTTRAATQAVVSISRRQSNHVNQGWHYQWRQSNSAGPTVAVFASERRGYSSLRVEGGKAFSLSLSPSDRSSLSISERREHSDVQLIPGLPNRLLRSSRTRFGNSARSQSGLPFHPFRRSLDGAATGASLYPSGPQIARDRFRIDRPVSSITQYRTDRVCEQRIQITRKSTKIRFEKMFINVNYFDCRFFFQKR